MLIADNIRPLQLRSHLLQCSVIDERCYQPSLDADGFAEARRNYEGIVSIEHDHVQGFALYELVGQAIIIHRLGVHPMHRRSGVGRSMIDRLTLKVANQGRRRIMTRVSDRNGMAQMFLRACGFRCFMTGRGVYLFEWLNGEAD